MAHQWSDSQVGKGAVVGTEKAPALKRLVLIYLGSSSMVSASHCQTAQKKPFSKCKREKCQM